jgi:hypothetical protein
LVGAQNGGSPFVHFDFIGSLVAIIIVLGVILFGVSNVVTDTENTPALRAQ